MADWRVVGNEGWKVGPDGELVGQGPNTALLTKRGDYRGCIVKVELASSPDIDAFFAFRENAEPGGKVIGLTARLVGSGQSVRAGFAGINGAQAESGNQPAFIKPDEVFRMEFHVRADLLRILTNGKVTAGTSYAPDLHPPGALGLHIAKGTVRIKKFEAPPWLLQVGAKPLDPLGFKGVVPPGDFVPLFNGKDLTGWQPHEKRPGNWRVENGILIGSAPVGGSLYTMRGDYADFHLRAETRINDKGFGRLFVRAAYDPTKIPFKVSRLRNADQPKAARRQDRVADGDRPDWHGRDRGEG